MSCGGGKDDDELLLREADAPLLLLLARVLSAVAGPLLPSPALGKPLALTGSSSADRLRVDDPRVSDALLSEEVLLSGVKYLWYSNPPPPAEAGCTTA